MALSLNKIAEKLPLLTKKEKNFERFVYVLIGAIVLGWVVFAFSSNYLFIKRIIAEQICPLESGMDGKIHGIQYLDTTEVLQTFDCSTLDLIIASDGEVVFKSYNNKDNSINGDYGAILLVGNLTIDAGGKISADGEGYLSTDNIAVANGQNAIGNSAGGGGANGGNGGDGAASDPDPVAEGGNLYGSSENPVYLGGAGGNSGTGGVGGAGGGSIKINAIGTITINGTISANGLDGATDNTSSGGGGAGGSIWLESDVLTGNGLVEAVGGISDNAEYIGGGGGGGRIIMFSLSSNTYSGTTNISGGVLGGLQNGGNGSILGPTSRPSAPSVLRQYKLDLTTELAIGSSTAEGEFVIVGDLTDADSHDNLMLEAEVRPIGTSFTNSATHTQLTPLSNPQSCLNSPTDCGKITIDGLDLSTEYHWQARAKDNYGGFSDWVSFGENPEGTADILLSGLPYSISINGGNNQTGLVYSTLVNELSVKVSDSLGYGIPGVTVTWSTIDNRSGGALLDGLISETDINGVATNRYKLGQKTGLNTVSASAKNLEEEDLVGSPITFNLTGTPDELSSFSANVPTYSVKDENFNLVLTAYDQYNNVKTDFVGTVSLSDVLSSDITQDGNGDLSVTTASFALEDNGVKTIINTYNQLLSIKVKITKETAIGYSNALAIVDKEGSCPDIDGIIDVDATWTADLTNQGIFDCRDVPELKINNGITLNLASYVSNDSNYNNDFGVVILADNLVIEATGTISSDGNGYPGGVAYSPSSHGGFNSPSSIPYGNVFEPETLGSAGLSGSPGAGGGAVHLVVNNTATINGVISSNGVTYHGVPGQTNGGAGGSIWIETGTITGSGIIQTNGGGSADANGASGGRIALHYTTNSGFTLDGSHLQSYGGSSNLEYGGPGTVYMEHLGVDSVNRGTLLVDNNNVNSTNNAGVPEGEFNFSKIDVKRYGHVEFMGVNSLLELVDSSVLVGDATIPLVKADGILRYLSGGTFLINGVNVSIAGKVEGVDNVTVGPSQGGIMTLYANTWYYSNSVGHIFGDMTVGPNGTVNLISYQNGAASYTDDYGVNLTLDNLNINSGGVLSANYNGYPKGVGYSYSTHGGFYQTNSIPYGNIYEPETLGSGSLNSGDNGGNGGGAVHLTISGTSTINGTLSSNGATHATPSGQGGAGGSIWIVTGTITGSGIIQTNGGGSADANGASGGRIALHYTTNSGFTLDGSHLQSYGGSSNLQYGGPGTVYIEHLGVDSVNRGTLLVDNNNVNSTNNAGVPEGAYNFARINVTRYGNVEFMAVNSLLELVDSSVLVGDATSPLVKADGILRYLSDDTFTIIGVNVSIAGKVEGVDNVTVGPFSIGLAKPGIMTLYANTWYYNNLVGHVFGDITVGPNGTVNLISYQNGVASYTDDYGVNLTLDNLFVQTGGHFSADSGGYPSLVANSPGTHAGYRSNESIPYGDLYEPVTLGSAGTINIGGIGGAGGGSMYLTVTGTLVVDGSITANGAPGRGDNGDGGAGGSIWIDTQNISGSGIIAANGGDSYKINGGSGGRIAIYYITNDEFTLDQTQLHAFGGSGDPAYGGPGSIFIKQANSYGTLIINNNGNDGRGDNFEAIDYTFDNVYIIGNTTVYLEPDLINDRGTRFLINDYFELDVTSVINGDGKGYEERNGPGKGYDAPIALMGGGGAGHGGIGGLAYEDDPNFDSEAGITYGSLTRPTELGSGGGLSGGDANGGDGGGSLIIMAPNGVVRIPGTIRVNGGNGMTGSPGGGGGSGGSIFILYTGCPTNIDGNLYANGGDGGDDIYDGGGGGGGRISLLNNGEPVTCILPAGIMTVNGGNSDASTDGNVGTIFTAYLPQISSANQYKRDNTQLPLGGTTYQNSVKIKALIYSYQASVMSPDLLKAQIEIVPANEDFSEVLGSTLVTTNTVSYSGGAPVEVEATITNLDLDQAYKWQIRVINESEGNVEGQWVDFGSNGSSPDFVVNSTSEIRALLTTTYSNNGCYPFTLSVAAYDRNNNLNTSYTGLVDFEVIPDPTIPADLPLSYQFTPQDQGLKEFIDGVQFNQTGTYKIRVTDRNNPSFVSDTAVVDITCGIPTQTPSFTPTPDFFGFTITPPLTITGTPIVTTGTITPTTIYTPPSPTTTLNEFVLISNVNVTLGDDGTTANICWNTNVPTLSNIDYGTLSGGTLTRSTSWTTNYATYVCIELENLEASASYLFKLNSTSAKGNSDYYNGVFDQEGTVVEQPDISACIDLKPIATNYNKDIIIDYTTTGESICTVKYGVAPESYSFDGMPIEVIKGLLHRSTLTTNLINSNLVYNISCNIDSDTSDYTCEKNGLVSYCDFGDCSESPTNIDLTLPLATVLPISLVLASMNVVGNIDKIFYGIITFKKRRHSKPWGIIYDFKTKEPVAFAILRIYDLNDRLITQDITDLQGRYGFILKTGKYKLTISHDRYKKNSYQINIRKNDELLTNNIGLSHSGIQHDTFMRNIIILLKKYLKTLNTILVSFGLIFSIIAFLVNPILINIVILAFYIFLMMYLFSSYMNANWGTVIDNVYKKPIKGAFIRLYDSRESRQVDVQITDEKGRFRFKVNKGNYIIKVDALGYVFPSATAGDIFTSKSGERFIRAKYSNKIISNKIVLDARINKSGTISNPFI